MGRCAPPKRSPSSSSPTRWIWSKPKDWWREKRVSHLLTSSTAPSTRPAPLTGAMWMMSSTPWFERLERETRRESSKKTKHRVGKSLEQYFQNDQARQAQGLRKHLLFSFSSTATEVL